MEKVRGFKTPRGPSHERSFPSTEIYLQGFDQIPTISENSGLMLLAEEEKEPL